MIHPSTELRFINNEIGYGVVANELIPKGTITWVLDKLDREFTSMELMAFDEPYQQILNRYCYRNNSGKFVLCWDNGRYVNHSFRSNCMSTAYDFEIAIRDIHPGEELTDDYGYLNLTHTFRATEEGTRRKYVRPDDIMKYYKIWDKKLQPAFKQAPRVAQPLQKILPTEIWDTCLKIAKGETPMTSILDIYFDPTKENSEETQL